MTDLPEPSFFEGGEPQSKIAPGDTGRELVHEVRNLATAVALLRAAFERQKRERTLERVLAVFVVLLTFGVLVGFALVFKSQADEDREARQVSVQTCEERNQSNAALVTLVSGISRQIQRLPPQDPAVREETIRLFETFAQQAQQIDCSVYLVGTD